MNKRDYRLSDWSVDEPITIVDHTMYDLSHIINNQNIPQSSSEGIDVFRLDDNKSTMQVMEKEKHSHLDFIELNFIRSGSGTSCIDNQTYPIRKGCVLCLRPGVYHGNIPMPKLMVQNCLISVSAYKENPHLFPYAFNDTGEFALSPLIHLNGEDIPHAEKLIDLMHKELDEKNQYYREQIINLMNELIIILIRAQQAPLSQKLFKGLPSVLTYIDDHFTTVTMSEAAALCGYNSTYFSRIFHDAMGLRFTEYVNNMRVNRSIFLLTTTDLSIEQIGCSVGFKNKTHFYNVFKSHTGLLPGSLRNPTQKLI